jgi:ketosteroid isomerase-like protein
VNNDPATSTPAELVSIYLAALQRQDVEALGALVTDDFVLEVPFDAAGTNDPRNALSWHGREDYLTNYCAIFPRIAVHRINDIIVRPTTDPDIVYAEAMGDMTLVDGTPYKNLYVFRFDFRAGKIRGLKEFCNPVTAAIAFRRPLPVSG